MGVWVAGVEADCSLDGEALGGRRLARTPPRRVTRWLAASTIALYGQPVIWIGTT